MSTIHLFLGLPLILVPISFHSDILLGVLLLIQNLFLVYFVNLYMLRAYLGPSSGSTNVCTQQLVLNILFRRLSDVLIGLDNRQTYKKNNKYQLLYKYGCTAW